MNLITKYLRLVWVGGFFLTPSLFGQAGNDNPGGPTAEYHGSSQVAGNYDPYTGNARREIDDIVVPGAIGAYPLKFTRTLSTRGEGVPYHFGGAGWSHSYDWGLTFTTPDTNDCTDIHYCGPVGTVVYPNGGRFDLGLAVETVYRIAANGPHGVEDLLIDCAVANSNCVPGAAYELRRGDGGKVLFDHLAGYRAYKIIDPYGQATTLTYLSNPNRLSRITEPGGRFLEIFYDHLSYTVQTSNGPLVVPVDWISMVRANDGRGNVTQTVTYGYEWVWQGYYFAEYIPYLNHVYYDDGAQATYTYADANSYDPPLPDLNHGHIRRVPHTCDDPRYAGPMKQIEYEYVPWTEATGDPYFIVRGQIKAEKNILHQVVSRTTYPTSLNDPNLSRRTETRGDGPSRTLTYGATGFAWTDFKNKSWIEANSTTSSYYGWTTTDPRENATKYERNDLDAVWKITYPQTDPTATPATREYTFDPNNPYLHSAEKDENGHWTYFDRDPTNPDPKKRGQLRQIRYPDSSTEEFTYNSFGQVLTHKLRSGGTETFTYDTRGLKQASYPPPTESDPDPWNHPTRYYYYESGPSIDRLWIVVDPRGNSTAYGYNQRGQITHVQHNDYTYTQSAYNLDGTLAWTADENHPDAWMDGHESERTRYEYDEYKRVTAVRLPGETLPTITGYALDPAWYDAALRKPLLHTTNSVKYTISPMNKNIIYDYDENLRKKDQVVAQGDATDEAWTLFSYDEVGNLIKTTDPRGKETSFGYDQRNRKIWMDDPIAADRSTVTLHTMEWKYDGVGNKTKETRADDAFRSWEYDVPNRITRAIDWRMSTAEPAVTTAYGRNATSTIETITDSKLAVYTFGFDALHRKISETYPIDATGEARTAQWWYDAAGNVRLYKNPGNQYKHLDHADSYDSRNRLRHSSWNADASRVTRDLNVGQEITVDYDAASRMTEIRTNDGETTVSFGYDDANRKVREDQTLAGYSTRRVNTPRDADGNRAYLDVANYFHVDYAYTKRNQLAAVNGFATFAYDRSGNLTDRTATWVYQSGTTYSDYDELNRARQIDYGNAWQIYSTSHYQYDTVGREVATWRDGDGKGKRFKYNSMSQLTSAKYNADQVWTGPNVTGTRNVTYDVNPLNRQSVVSDNGFFEGYFADNGMNQYNQVGGVSVGYDGNFNLTNFNGGLSFHYDAENHLVSGSMQATYDGLGRCVRRTVGGITRLFTYDDWKPFLEWDGAGNWLAWNIYGAGADEILARYDVWGRISIYKQDQHGNVTFVLNQFGNVVEKYTYDAFGKPTIFDAYGNVLTDANGNPHSAIGNRFLFTGREYIQELSIYDYRHRMYMPGIGRFLQMDPTGFDAGDMNLFRYCDDDPVDGSDPTGLVNTNAGTTLEERMRLFYGSGDTGGGLYDLNVNNSRTLNLAKVDQYRNEGQPHWSAKSERAEAKKLLLRQIKFGEDSTGGGTDEAPYIIEPIMGRKVYKNPNDSPSLRRVDHIEEPGIPGHSRFLTHVHTRVGVDKEGHRLEDPTHYDKEALKTTGRMYFTNRILAPQGRYEIYREGKSPEMRDDLYR